MAWMSTGTQAVALTGLRDLTCTAMPLTVNRLTLRYVSDTYSLELQ
jgi:hypothetical protein